MRGAGSWNPDNPYSILGNISNSTQPTCSGEGTLGKLAHRKVCDCPISGHLSRFIRRASDGDGRSIISSTLVMFGVRCDKKIGGPGDSGNGDFEMASFGSEKFCMSETDTFRLGMILE